MNPDLLDFKVYTLLGSGLREEDRKTLNSPPPTDILSLQSHMEQFPLKKKSKGWLGEDYTLGKQEENHTDMGRREWDAVLALNPPQVQHPITGRELKTWSFSLRSERFKSYIRHPNF